MNSLAYISVSILIIIVEEHLCKTLIFYETPLDDCFYNMHDKSTSFHNITLRESSNSLSQTKNSKSSLLQEPEILLFLGVSKSLG